MSRPFVIVEQIGDVTFQAADRTYDRYDTAMLALVELTVGSDEEREYFLDGPGLVHPIVGQQWPSAD